MTAGALSTPDSAGLEQPDGTSEDANYRCWSSTRPRTTARPQGRSTPRGCVWALSGTVDVSTSEPYHAVRLPIRLSENLDGAAAEATTAWSVLRAAARRLAAKPRWGAS